MKKTISLVLVLALCATLCTFVACQPKEAEAATVMTMSLNPEVEFVLDINGNVLTVNAINEEGNLIISAEAFANVEGKSAEQAAQLFVQVAKETGYLVSGNVSDGENEIEFSFSGEVAVADELYAEISATLNTYFSKENITAALQRAEAITREQLEELVEQCSPYIEEAQIKAMEYRQLLAELAQSRRETAEMYSQQLKDAYYEAKTHAMEQAKFEVVREKLSTAQQAAFDLLNTAYTTASQTLENVRNTYLISETSAYQQALADVREAKANYLNFRAEISLTAGDSVSVDVQQQLNALKAALQLAEDALVAAGEIAEQALSLAKSTLDSAYDAAMQALQSVDIDSLANDISEKQTEALTAFTQRFETNYAAAEEAALNSWKQMEQALRGE